MTTTTFITWVTIIHQQNSNDSPPFFRHVKPASCFVYPNTVSSFHKCYLKLTSHSGIPCKHSYQKHRAQKSREHCASTEGFLRCMHCFPRGRLTLLRSHKLRKKLGWATAKLCPTLFWETRGPALAEGCKQHLVKWETANCNVLISCIRFPQTDTAPNLSGYLTTLTSDQRR